MTLSTANRALLTRKLGKAPPAGDFAIRLKADALNSILDAARGEGRADNIGDALDKALAGLRRKDPMDDILAILRRVGADI